MCGLHAAYGGRSRIFGVPDVMVHMAALCASAVGLVPNACLVFMRYLVRYVGLLV